MHFVSKTCAGVRCACGRPATHKIGEEIYPDHPAAHSDPIINAAEQAVIRSLPPELQDGHNLTVYVCCEHFRKLMGSAAPCDEEKISYTPVQLRAYFEPDDTEEDHGELRKMLVWAADEIEQNTAAYERACERAAGSDLKLRLVEGSRDDARLASDVQAKLIEELRGYNEGLAQELSWEKGINKNLLEEHRQLSEQLRVAEAVRDDARAASQRCLDEKRALMGPATYVRMASDRLEAVAKSELRILAEFAAQEIKQRDDKIVAIAVVLQGEHDDASAMVEAIRKIVGEKRVHVECVPGGTGPCACFDGCGACDSCGRWMEEACPHPAACRDALARGADPCDAVHSFKVEPYQSYLVWARPDASSTEIRDSIIAAVGMMADARTPEMQAAYDAALARESKIDSPAGPVSPPGSGGNERGIDGAFPPLTPKARGEQMMQMQQDAAEKRRLLELGKIVVDTGVANTPVSSDRAEGWKKGVLESIDKLTAFQMNGNSLTYEKALELLNTLYHHPPTFSTTVITREQLVQDKVYETWVPTAADGAIVGEPLAQRLAEQEESHEQCGDCGAEIIGHHACQGVPGGFGDDEDPYEGSFREAADNEGARIAAADREGSED